MIESTSKKVEKNPKVVEKASRRRFTAEYKQRAANMDTKADGRQSNGQKKRLQFSTKEIDGG